MFSRAALIGRFIVFHLKEINSYALINAYVSVAALILLHPQVLINELNCRNKDIKTWMAANFLLLDSDQTEVIGPENCRNMVSNQIGQC